MLALCLLPWNILAHTVCSFSTLYFCLLPLSCLSLLLPCLISLFLCLCSQPFSLSLSLSLSLSPLLRYLCIQASVSPQPEGGVTGVRCSPGSYCPAGTQHMMPCPPGSFSPVQGSVTQRCSASHFKWGESHSFFTIEVSPQQTLYCRHVSLVSSIVDPQGRRLQQPVSRAGRVTTAVRWAWPSPRGPALRASTALRGPPPRGPPPRGPGAIRQVTPRN